MGIAAGVGAAAAAVSAGTALSGAMKGGRGGGGGGVQIPRQVLAPSFNTYLDGGTSDFTIKPTDTVNAILGRVRDITSGAASDIGALRSQVTPGFGRLTDATRTVFANARQRLADARLAATSDLRGNLEKRRVLGSSFATDSLARADAEFAKADQELTAQENAQQAQNFLLELDQTTQLINQQASLDLKGILTELDQLNFTSTQGVSIVSGVQSALTSNAQIQADLAARSAAGSGAFAGMLLGKGISAAPGVIDSLSKLFNGGSGGDFGGAVSQEALNFFGGTA